MHLTTHIMHPYWEMKQRRHDLIKQFISAQKVRNQAEIVARLKSKGFDVTQASVSRDLEEIGVQKRNGFYGPAVGSGFGTGFGQVTLARSGDSLIVAKCGSGLASALAVQIDSLWVSEIVGTIAGDDTVFIAVKNAVGQAAVLKTLKERFGV